MTERRTRLVVDIVWNGEDDARQDDHYYTDSELPRVATDWIEGVFEDRDDSPRVHITPVEGASSDRGRDSGEALTAVRTVLSRAETALEELGPDGAKIEWPPRTGNREWDNFSKREAARFEDPDAPAMRVALRTVITVLSPWRKTGRTTRSTCL